MLFNYDPILGLQYLSCENEYVHIDLEAIGEIPIEEIMDLWRRSGICIIDSTPVMGETNPIISNVPYFE
jgi:hypothetical protein